MKEQDEIEQLFSSSFDGFEQTPPLDVKSAIDASLFSGGTVAPTESRKRRKGIIWWFILALIIGIAGFGSLFFLTNRTNDKNASGSLAQNSSKNENSSKSDNKFITVMQSKVHSSKSSKTNKIDSEKSTEQMTIVSSNSAKKENTGYFSSPNLRKKKKTISNKVGLKKNSILTEGELKLTSRGDEFASTKTKMTEDEPSNIKLDLNFETKKGADENSNSLKQSPIDLAKTEIKIDTVQVTESKTTNVITSNTATDNKVPISKASSFSLTIFSGTTFGLSSLKQPSTSNFEIKESLGFSSNIEVNYILNSRFGLGAGVDINSRTDNFYKIETKSDSVYVGMMSQYIYDSQNTDSIIDTIYVEQYDVSTFQVEQSQFIRHTSFALPLSFNWNFYNKGKWNYGLATVVRLSYVNNKLVSNEHNFEIPTFKKFSARLSLRPQVIYSFDKFSLGAYLTAGYDLIPIIHWTDIQRNRLDLGAGLLLRIKL